MVIWLAHLKHPVRTVLISFIFLVGCTIAPDVQTSQSIEIAGALACQLEKPDRTLGKSVLIEDNDLENVRDHALPDPQAKDLWTQQIAWLSTGKGKLGWIDLLRLEPGTRPDLASKYANPVWLSPDEVIEGYLLLHNGWQRVRQPRILFLLDFQQLQVSGNGKENPSYEMPSMEADSEAGIHFTLGKLSPGFHQLSVIIIGVPVGGAERENFKEFIINQSSSKETRYDLWVGINQPPESTFTLYQEGMNWTTAWRINHIEIERSLDRTEDEPVLEIKPEQEAKLDFNAFLYTCGKDCDPILQDLAQRGVFEPLKLGVFLDDSEMVTFDCQIQENLPEKITLPLRIGLHEGGLHGIRAALFLYPGLSQFDPVSHDFILSSRTLFSPWVPVGEYLSE